MTGIFISYRRKTSSPLAQLIFRELRQRGHDVFLDVTTIDSGAFDRIILNQIAARPHFLLILSPGSLERCANEGDWLRREIEEAFRLQRNIIPIFDEGFNIDHEKQYLTTAIQSELLRLNAPPYSHYYFDAFIETISNRFLKTPAYDVKVIETPTAERTEVQRRIDQAARLPQKPALISSKDILPAPFEWIDIPVGSVIVKGKTETLPPFQIAKYPITNAQYAKFIEAGGYQQEKWWTQAGWEAREQAKWVEPRFWQDQKWNGADYPVVGVTWYEAVSFCLWLSGISGENIMLPMEQQWQRAAQGDDGRGYPWGNEWDASRCNSAEAHTGKTTPVQHYEGKGDSPFGVVDMSGNVWEWCATDYKTGNQDINIKTEYRVARGGSWNYDKYHLRTSYRYSLDLPTNQDNYLGFRCVRLNDSTF